MLVKFYRLLILLNTVYLLAACGGGNNNANDPDTRSSDFVYKTVSVLSSNVNDAIAIDAAPELSANGLELYFHSNRLGGVGSMDIYVAKRASISDNWGTATILAASINSIADDRAADISANGLSLIFVSNRSGGMGNFDLYISIRSSLNDAWGTAVNLGQSFNTAFIESGPSLSTDALSLYFHSDSDGGLGLTDIYVVTRNSVLDPWGARVNLSVLNSSGNDGAPEVASDGLTLYFHTNRSGSVRELWRTSRSRISKPWNTPSALLTAIQTTESVLTPALSNDWLSLYFARGVNGNLDIWQAQP